MIFETYGGKPPHSVSLIFHHTFLIDVKYKYIYIYFLCTYMHNTILEVSDKFFNDIVLKYSDTNIACFVSSSDQRR